MATQDAVDVPYDAPRGPWAQPIPARVRRTPHLLPGPPSMTEAPNRLKAALADRYAIEGEMGGRTHLPVETRYARAMILPTSAGITPTTAEQDQQHYDDEDGRGAHGVLLRCSRKSVGRSAAKGCMNDTFYQPRILSHDWVMDFRISTGTPALSGNAPGPELRPPTR
jgi:hypothetical protein